IRLLRLYPAAERDSEIRCEIIHTNLIKQPIFEAVSYTWGDLNLSQPVRMAEGFLYVTKNCEDALRDLRLSFAQRNLWIDAICINQQSTEDKNHQIPLMSRIYANAQQVVIYVGASDQTTTFDPEDFFDALRHENATPFRQEDLSSFLSRPWFSRVWV
ncbi:hypothetical protein BS50DRAFT_445588, partial [Corynespora cassiicola Philippines]